MTDTVSGDSVARDQLRAFVDRILRMKEEAKAINDDIREIYAEAKGNGFDKTVLGKLVSYVEKRAKSADTLAEQDALFDLYLKSYDGVTFDDEDEASSRTHAHAREEQRVADCIANGIDPDTGEIVDMAAYERHIAASYITNTGMVPAATTDKQTPAAVVASHEAEHGTVSSADYQREPASVPLVSESLSDADAQRLTAGPHPAPTEPPNVVADAQAVPSAAQAGEVSSKASPAPIQPETADEIESGERAVTGIGPESTAKAGREKPEDAPDAALTAIPTGEVAAGKSGEGAEPSPAPPDTDKLYAEALEVVLASRNPSQSMVQRRLNIGWNLAGELVDRMEREGIVQLSAAGFREVAPEHLRQRVPEKA